MSVSQPAQDPGRDTGHGDDAAKQSAAGPTGDAVIDAALRELESADPENLDAQIAAATLVHQTLHGRLSDLAGE
jgi:hypothetical protein